MTSEAAKGFMSAIRCVVLEGQQWTRQAEETTDTGARAVMMAVATAHRDTAQRMIESLIKAGELRAEDILQ